MATKKIAKKTIKRTNLHKPTKLGPQKPLFRPKHDGE